MQNPKQNLVSQSSDFNTLANNGTTDSDKYYSEPTHKLLGTGTGQAAMKKRPTKKLLDQKTMLAMVDVAKNDGDTIMQKKYWNTYHCFSSIKTSSNKAHGSYCKNRFCSVCNGNRKAVLINQYKPIIELWQEPYFLTLTRTSVKRPFLKSTMLDNNIKFGKVIGRLKKRHQRGVGPKIVALRSTECNYNPIDETYNPHYHIITINREVGRQILIEWLREQNKNQSKKIARPSGQCLKKIRDREQNLIEVIKYGVKVMTDPDMKKGKYKTQLPIIYAAALHEIHKAFSSQKLLTKYGFSLPKQDHKTKEQTVTASKIKEWQYDPNTSNYIEENTAEVMYSNKHLPSPQIEYIATERIDTTKT